MRKKKRDVLFCHVPALVEEEDVVKGVRAVEKVIRGAVATKMARVKREEAVRRKRAEEEESKSVKDGIEEKDGGLDGVV
jgi:hypothetical protein